MLIDLYDIALQRLNQKPTHALQSSIFNFNHVPRTHLPGNRPVQYLKMKRTVTNDLQTGTS